MPPTAIPAAPAATNSLSTCAFANALSEVVIKSRQMGEISFLCKAFRTPQAIRRFSAYCRRPNQSELLQYMYMSNARKLALTESQAACLIAPIS
jgi:hypothetical protein